MKIKTFNIWTKSVEQFIETITTGTELHAAVDSWFDSTGGKLFEKGQGIYFASQRAKYLAERGPCSEEIYILAHGQIIAGFDCVFAKLLAVFPALERQSTSDAYSQLMAECTGEQYYAYIAARAVITMQYVKRREPEDIQFVEELYEVLKEACQASIDSIKEHTRQQKNAVPAKSKLVPDSVSASSPLMQQRALNLAPLVSPLKSEAHEANSVVTSLNS